MKSKMDQFSVNLNPMLSAAKDGTILYSNDASKPILNEWGVRVGDKPPLSIIDLVQRVISRNSPEKIEVKAGNKVYLVVLSPLPEQELVSISGFDISDQTNLEQEFLESEENLAEVQNMAHIGNWKWNTITGELFWSDEVYRIFGLEPQAFEATFDNYFKYVHPDDRDYINNAIKKACDGEPYSVDNRIITANGEERIVHTDAEIIFNEDNIPVYARGIVQDVTERKLEQQKLDSIRMLLAEGQKVAHFGSFEYNVATCETFWSDEEFRLFGLEPGPHSPTYDELMQNHFHPEDASRVEQYFAEVLNSGSIYEIEYRIVRPDGSVRNFYDIARPVFDTAGKIVKYVGATLDITERKKAEEALKAAKEQIETIFNVIHYSNGQVKCCT